MKSFLLCVILSIFTFGFGIFVSQIDNYPFVSLEEISANSKLYDGKKIEIVSYASVSYFDQSYFLIGEPFEKSEQSVFLNLKENSVDLTYLQKQLSENLSENNYKRVKVSVRGKLIDNCNTGGILSLACCSGGSLEMIVKDVKQIGEVEDYTVPYKFQVKSNNKTQ